MLGQADGQRASAVTRTGLSQPHHHPLTPFSSHSLASGASHFQTRYGQSVCARQAGRVVAGVGSFTFDILQRKVSPSCPWGGLGPIQWRGAHLGSLGRGAVLSQVGVWVSPDGTGPETWRLAPEAQDGAEATSLTEEALERAPRPSPQGVPGRLKKEQI